MSPNGRQRAVLALALLAGCHGKPAAPDDAGVARIVSLSPSTTEAVFAVGAGASLVGRSRYCDYPPEVASLPQVGGYVDPNFEAILALRPTLVTGARGPAGAAITARLEARGVATFFPETESFAAIDAMLLGIGDRTGHAEDAKKSVDRVHARIAAVENSIATLPRKRVLLVFGAAPLSVAGPASFADEMIRRAGGTNVVTEGGTYPTIGVERVMALDPDVVVSTAMVGAEGERRIDKDTPGWGKVRAIAEGHVVSLKDEAVLRPGPRIGDGLASLAHAIHPEANP